MIWLMSAMIINISYTSSLISSLISPRLTRPIMSFQELLDSDIGWESVRTSNLNSTFYVITKFYLGELRWKYLPIAN